MEFKFIVISTLWSWPLCLLNECELSPYWAHELGFRQGHHPHIHTHKGLDRPLPPQLCLPEPGSASAPQAPYYQVVESPTEMAPEGRLDARGPGHPTSPFCLRGAQLLTTPLLLPMPPSPLVPDLLEPLPREPSQGLGADPSPATRGTR